MNKRQLANAISDKLGLVYDPDVMNFLDAFTVTVFEALKRGEPVSIRGLGTFQPAARRVSPKLQHITTGAPMGGQMVKSLKFIPAQAFREGLNDRLRRRERDKVRAMRRMMEG